VTDALGQVKTYSYTQDNLPVGIAYSSTVNPPPNVGFAYDPFGVPLQATAPVTDFIYAGMSYNADSGLYLTNYRAYDPVAGPWLSRDPLGEMTDPVGNHYVHAGRDPLNTIDPRGLQYIPPDVMQDILSAHGCDTRRTRPGNSVFNKEYSNPANLRQLSDDVFASPGGPLQPMPHGGYTRIQGQAVLQNQQTGQTVP
jgi:RHS repeat-associated protein